MIPQVAETLWEHELTQPSFVVLGHEVSPWIQPDIHMLLTPSQDVRPLIAPSNHLRSNIKTDIWQAHERLRGHLGQRQQYVGLYQTRRATANLLIVSVDPMVRSCFGQLT